MGANERLRLVILGLKVRHQKDAVFEEVTCGYGYNCPRMDFVAIEKTAKKKPLITGYEIKTSHSDYIQDRKWDQYLEHCNEFYFACPKGVIQPDEVDVNAGLVWVYNTGTRCKRKALYRPIEPSWDILYRILLSHLDAPNRFSDRMYRADRYQEYVNGKKSLRELGYAVAQTMSKQMQELEKNVVALNSSAPELRKAKAIKELLNEYGIWDSYNLPDRLKELIASYKYNQCVDRIRYDVDHIKESLHEFECLLDKVSKEGKNVVEELETEKES